MTESPPPSDTGPAIDEEKGAPKTAGTARWMKVIGVGIIVVVVLVVILMVAGGGLGGHGPGMHTP